MYAKEWIGISKVINKLEKLMKEYNINIATIDGKAIAELSMKKADPDIGDLIMCVINRDEVLKV